MPLYKMTLCYDGTEYAGWQVQLNGLSVQQLMQDKMAVILRHPVELTGSGRTDSGVHALNQTAHFETDALDPYRLIHALNGILPPDIRVKSIEEAPPGFHARYSAKGKIYHYHINHSRYHDPFTRNYAWHIPYRAFSVGEMRNASEKLLGTHDFKGFANESHRGIASYDSVRTMRRIDFVPLGQGVRLEFEADGFLYKMVRNIVGTLVDIGRGHFEPSIIDKVFETKDRGSAGSAAPPHGLFLAEVIY